VELTALSSRIGKAKMHFLNFYVSHGSATRFLRGGNKHYIYFVDNLLLFQTIKEFSKSVDNSTPRFLRHSVFRLTFLQHFISNTSTFSFRIFP